MIKFAEKITCYTQLTANKRDQQTYLKILGAARQHNITSGTVHQGSMTYPSESTSLGHKTFGHSKLPVTLQFIDSTEKLTPFIEELTTIAAGTLITREKIEVISYGAS